MIFARGKSFDPMTLMTKMKKIRYDQEQFPFNLLHHEEVSGLVVRWKLHALHKLMYRIFYSESIQT